MTYKDNPSRIERLRMLELESADVEFRDGAFRFRSKDVVLTGLHHVMDTQFCPNLFRPPAKMSKESEKKQISKKRKADRMFLSDFGYPRSAYMSEAQIALERTREIIRKQTSFGRKQGIFVDQQCSAILRQEESFPVSSQSFQYDSMSYSFWSQYDLSVRPEALTKIHPFAVMVLSELVNRGYVHVTAQLPVMHEKHRIATAADQLWWSDEEKRFVLIEVKCERAQNFDVVSPVPMMAPLQAVPNTARNRALVQVALTKYMLERTYPVTTNCLAFVVRVHSDSPLLKMYPLSAEMYAQSLLCWNNARGS